MFAIYRALKSIDSLEQFLPTILTIITKTPRHKPQFEWSSNSFIYNIFRVYEVIFWRKLGIRAESATNTSIDEYGKKTVRVDLISLESVCVYTEHLIKRFFKFQWLKIDFSKVEITRLELALPNQALRIPWISFAIAFDATANSGSKSLSTGFSYNVTITGSSTALIAGVAMDDSTVGDRVVDTHTYNSSNLTLIDTATQGNNTQELWYILNASTGTNSLANTLHGTNSGAAGGAISLSGVGSFDAKNKAVGTSLTPSCTVTTVADLCAIVDGMNYNGSTGLNVLTTTGSGQVSKVVVDAGSSAQICMSYKLGITPGGTGYAMAWSSTGTARDFAQIGASFAPPGGGGGGTTVKQLAAMGVG